MDLDVDRYLERIGYDGPTEPSAATLAALQRAHLVAAPFENLDVHGRVPVRTTLDWSIPKIVDARRGGWCFELNGAFGALLAALGYDVTYQSAQVWDAAAKVLGPPLDHLCLLVVADGERWLADVGFGDSTLTPVRLDTADEQDRRPRHARVEAIDGRIHYFERSPAGDWELQYAVDPTPRRLPEFQARSDALADGSGGGHFTEKPFATRALDGDGSRVWLLKDRLKLRTGDGDRPPETTPVDPEQWDATLLEWFAIERPSRT